jgi:predicted CXXCH cytochrome family protein
MRKMLCLIIAGNFRRNAIRVLLPLVLVVGFASADAEAREVTILPGQTCTSSSCHEQFGKEKVVHPAMDDDDCSSCHDQQGEGHEFEYTEEDDELCLMCHDAFEEKKNQHAALEEGCITCHNPHQSRMKALLEEDSVKDLCFICHDDSILATKQTHAPAEMGGCEVCHNPHESDHRSLLKESPTTLCLLCHTDVDTALREGRARHMPVREDCTDCHNPHGSDMEYLVEESVPGLCFECHDDIEDAVKPTSVKHNVMLKNKSCMNCHVPHASPHSGLLKQNAREVCIGCHSTVIETPKGKIAAIGEQIVNRTVVHSPVEDGECPTCHDPHGLPNYRFLREKYPEQYFAPYSEETYALCFTCHDEEVLTYRKTATLTEFRNGTRNLHFMHVTEMHNRCTSCHDVHASFEKHLIRESSLLGRKELMMNFKKSQTGGSCNPGCHDSLTYDRENPISQD